MNALHKGRGMKGGRLYAAALVVFVAAIFVLFVITVVGLIAVAQSSVYLFLIGFTAALYVLGFWALTREKRAPRALRKKPDS